ncbi:hypothetical protein [Fuerstiella marisgermanici]|uniref:O-antigen translocase n=1 Tax=Fuerstiella marisgermanici TaxID=1891926 RepID=A0A1P8WPF9_9PLAN|nr:hypothetical protein [Fuerstiella marisgermanici]APZ95931.1 O-antigen translocase [Fuerstiella marisgermanici]
MSAHAKAVAKLSISSAVAIVSQIAKGKIGAVVLGPAGMGVLSQLKYLWNLLHFLFGLGFYNGLVRHVAEANANNDPKRVREQISTLLCIISVICLTGSLVAMFCAESISLLLFPNDDHTGLVLIVLLAVPLAVTARMYKGILSAYKNVQGIVVSQVTADALSVVTFGILTYSHGVSGAAIALVVYHATRAILNVTIACRSHGARHVIPRMANFSISIIGENLSFSAVSMIIMPTSILTSILVSRWIIAAYGTTANGVFAAAWLVSSVYLRILYESASSYLLPVLASSKSNVDLNIQLDKALRLYMLLVPPVVILLVTTGELAISAMFSRDFSQSGELLVWLLPADLLRIISETIGLSMLANNRLKAYLFPYLCRAATYLLLSQFTLIEHGLSGICYAYAGSHTLYVLLQLGFARRLFGYWPSSRASRIIIRGILCSLVAAFLTTQFPTIIARLATLFCVLGFWTLQSMREPEAIQLLQFIRRKFAGTKPKT